MKEFQCDAVLFDLDGVLVDSNACIERHWRQWAAKHRLDENAVLRVVHGRPTVESIRLLAPELPAAEEAARLNADEAYDTDGVLAIDGAAQLIRSLPPDAWAVATSGTRDTATTRLRHTGLPVPSVLITADNVQRGKPDPEPYLQAAFRLGIEPAKCVVIEDAPPGISSARAAGMRVVGVATTYSFSALGEADVRVKQLTDVYITGSSEQAASRLTVQVTNA